MSDQLECECGCGEWAHQNRMTIVRSNWTLGSVTRPGRLAFHVRKECAERFEAELMRVHAVENLLRENLEANIWRRLWIAPQIYDLKCEILVRRHGEKVARRAARNAVLLLLLPKSIGLRLKFLTKPLDAKQKS